MLLLAALNKIARTSMNVVVAIETLILRVYKIRREIDCLSTPLGKHFGETCGLDSWRIQIIGRYQFHRFTTSEGTVPYCCGTGR